MTITTGYNTNGLSPKVLIYDLTDTLQYTYESKQLNNSPTQDFYLRDLSVHLGKNDDYGNAVLLIDDPDNALTDSTARKGSRIKRQWSIKIYFGKDGDTINLWFTGKIMESDVIRPTTNLQQIRLVCSGWGIRLRDRVTNISRFQAKDTDGITLLTSDTNTRVSELAKDVVTDTDHYINPTLSAESITTTNVGTVDVKLADFQRRYTTFASAIADLAGSGAATYFVDENKDLNFVTASSTDSGYLFTNNLSGSTASNWSSTKIGYLYKQEYSWTDSTSESGYSYLYGYGPNVSALDVAQTSSNSTRSLHLTWLAIPFTPTRDTISKIALSLSKTGTPALVGDFRIVGDDASGKPNVDDLRKQSLVTAAKLQTLTGSGAWTEIPFDNVKVSPREQLFLVCVIYGSASHTIVADYQTGAGEYYTSADGVTWSAAAVGDFKIRTYSSNPILITLEDISARNKFGVREKVIPFRINTQEETARRSLIMASNVLCKEVRTYSQICVTPPTSKPTLGQLVTIEDSFNSLYITGELCAIDISLTAVNETNVGANKIYLTIQEYHY